MSPESGSIHVADRKGLHGAVQMEGLYRQKEVGTEGDLDKSGLFQARSASLRGGRGLSGRSPH